MNATIHSINIRRVNYFSSESIVFFVYIFIYIGFEKSIETIDISIFKDFSFDLYFTD